MGQICNYVQIFFPMVQIAVSYRRIRRSVGKFRNMFTNEEVEMDNKPCIAAIFAITLGMCQILTVLPPDYFTCDLPTVSVICLS